MISLCVPHTHTWEANSYLSTGFFNPTRISSGASMAISRRQPRPVDGQEYREAVQSQDSSLITKMKDKKFQERKYSSNFYLPTLDCHVHYMPINLIHETE